MGGRVITRKCRQIDTSDVRENGKKTDTRNEYDKSTQKSSGGREIPVRPSKEKVEMSLFIGQEKTRRESGNNSNENTVGNENTVRYTVCQ